MFTGPVGPLEVFFYWPEAVLGNIYWPGAIGSPLASSPEVYNLPLNPSNAKVMLLSPKEQNKDY